MVTAILFDLDGTLLPMDQDVFLNAYLGELAAKMTSHGYDPKLLVKSIWKGTGAMVINDGSASNEEVFWKVLSAIYGKDVRRDEPIFLDFYLNEFQNVRKACGFDQLAAEAIREIKAMGYRVALATNPLFPAVATHSRIRWAGMEPNDFEYITTYENSSRSKPNPDYYREVLDKINVSPEECVMVGNDINEDMIAETLGMRVFLLTDSLINRDNKDISQYPHGSFPELLNYIRSL